MTRTKTQKTAAKDTSKVKVSYLAVRAFRLAAIDYIKAFPQETKLKHAIEKMFERTTPIEQAWSKKLEDIELTHAATDKNKIVQFSTDKETGQRVYQFTADGLGKRDEAVQAEFSKANKVEVEPYVATELPKDLDEGWVRVFRPFVVAPDAS